MMRSQQFFQQQRQERTSQQEVLLRILDETLSPTADDPAEAGEGTMEPSNTSGGEDTSAGSKDASKGFGWFSLTVFLLVVAFVLWRLWVRYQHRQEQRLMDYRSAQADKVLGDMQMVPQHDDLDNELL